MTWLGVMPILVIVGRGIFIPLKHYDPDEEEELLKKYLPEKVKEEEKKSGGGKGRPNGKRGKSMHSPQSEPGNDPQP